MGLNSLFKTKLSPEQKELAKFLYNIFGLRTHNIYIYELAFRHKSVAAEVKHGCKDSYERLEFLGDSILGAVIAEHLFKKYPFKPEGFLTDLRSKIVCGKFLSKIAMKLGLNNLIHFQGNGHNTPNIAAYGDVVEAVIGAMFVDKGFEYTKNVILDRIVEIHVDLDELVETETNFKSRLIEWAQREKCELQFVIKDTKVISGQKQYTIEVNINSMPISEAKHYSIKETEQLAAEKAIEQLKEEGKY